ncbi:MAG TPA: nitrate reductase subunit beta, partial [Alphaproteobacteria bacterium]|nr:nitrate reductase subunit beta [Alphaproteobacteria bacterium]
TGQPPACFQACPGRIRYMGPLLYDLDKVAETANSPIEDVVQNHRDIILNPNDPDVIKEALRQGVTEAWLDACRRSPVYHMVKDWEIALPLHPEFRTLPNLFYIPPESPVANAVVSHGRYDMVGKESVLPNLDEFRIPMKYLARMLAAGNTELVAIALRRQLAVRMFRRAERVEGVTDDAVLREVGLSIEDARAMHRILALAHFHERFVVPTTRSEKTSNAPYIERGFAGFDELAPGKSPHRRKSFHGGSPEVAS